jgi:hypothetical protein
MLLSMNSSIAAGTVMTAIGTGTQSGSDTQYTPGSMTIGYPAMSITKSQSKDSAVFGDSITYYISYHANGSKLAAFQTFDDINTGIYGTLNGTGGTPVPGWSFVPSGGTEGQWEILDFCGNGDRVIRASTGANNQFPVLLYDGVAGGGNMCS